MNKSGILSDKEYKYVYSRAPRLCVDLVIKKDGGILLSKREIEPNKGFWHFPGGRVKHRESIEGAIQRVANGELGIRVKILKLLGFIEYPEEGENMHTVSLAFLVELESGDIKSSFQAKEFRVFKKIEGKIPREQVEFWKKNLRKC